MTLAGPAHRAGPCAGADLPGKGAETLGGASSGAGDTQLASIDQPKAVSDAITRPQPIIPIFGSRCLHIHLQNAVSWRMDPAARE